MRLALLQNRGCCFASIPFGRFPSVFVSLVKAKNVAYIMAKPIKATDYIKFGSQILRKKHFTNLKAHNLLSLDLFHLLITCARNSFNGIMASALCLISLLCYAALNLRV